MSSTKSKVLFASTNSELSASATAVLKSISAHIHLVPTTATKPSDLHTHIQHYQPTLIILIPDTTAVSNPLADRHPDIPLILILPTHTPPDISTYHDALTQGINDLLTLAEIDRLPQAALRAITPADQSQNQTTHRLTRNFQLAQAQAIAHLGSWSLNFKTRETSWSDEFFRICGLPITGITPTPELARNHIHPDDLPRVSEAIAQAQQSGHYVVENRIVQLGGAIRWVISQGEILFDNEGQPDILLGTFLDITDRKLNELALERSAKRLASLNAIDRAILRADSLAQIAEGALENLAALIPCYRLSVLTINAATCEAYLVAIWSAANQITAVVPQQTYTMRPEELDNLQQQPYRLIQELNNYPSDTAKVLYREGIRAILSIGLKNQDELIGAMNLHATEENFFSDEDIEIAVEVAHQLAISIRTHQLNEEVRTHASKLEARVAHRTAELNQEKMRLEAILNSSSEGITLINSQLRFLHTNPTFCQIVNAPAKTCDQYTLLDFVSPAEHGRVLEAIYQVWQKNSVMRLEVNAQRLGGEPFYADIGLAKADQPNDANGSEANVVCTLQDITERKQAELARRTSEELYRTTVAAMFEGITVQNKAGYIELCNAAAEQILGLTADQIMGRTSTDPMWRTIKEDGSAFPGEEHPSMMALLTGQPQNNVVMGVYKPDSSLTWILINSRPLFGSDETPHTAVTTFTDITAQKQSEQTLANALEQEKELNELKSRFLAMASHEFRRPLTVILFTAEGLMRHRDKQTFDEQIAQLARIQKQVIYMRRIMDDVLNLTRIETGQVEYQPKQGDLATFCEEIIADFTDQPQNHGRVQFIPPPASTSFHFDSSLMRQVLNNLISNALKYSSPTQPIIVQITKSNTDLTLNVTDSGIGIPLEDQKHIFEPFHRARNVGQVSGTGLGLTICKNIIEKHGGDITVSSIPQQGTTFTIVFPTAVAN